MKGRYLRYLPAVAMLVLAGCSFTAGRAQTYTVRRGDTLYTIAQRHGCDPEALRRINSVTNPRLLQAGQVLTLPSARSASEARASLAHGCFDKSGRSNSCGGGAHKASEPRPSPQLRTVSLAGGSRRYQGTLVWPVAGGRMASGFGYRFSSFHEGIDILAAEGTPVFAAHDGTVAYSGTMRGYGKMIVVRGEGVLSVYAHNRRNLASAGQQVRRGEQIAEVGHTGRATAPHLHFELRVKDAGGRNVAVDPAGFFSRRQLS